MAKSAPFFPFYVDDWLEDEAIFDMGLECEGAYIRLLSAMWKREGLVPDKENWCCNILRCKPAKWRKIRARLIEVGVLKIDNNSLFNERLMKEVKFFKEKCEKNEENANKRWKKSIQTDTKKVNEINEPIHAVALRAECHTDTDTDTDTDLLNTMSSKPDDAPVDNFSLAVDNSGKQSYISQAQEVLEFINEKFNRNFQAKSPAGKTTANADFIIARIKEGYTVQNMRTVAIRKWRDWKDSDTQVKYLRPETLFCKKHFSGYLGECVAPKQEVNEFEQFAEIDFEDNLDVD